MSDWTGLDRNRSSVAMSTEIDARIRAHVTRADGQEDLCFALWHPSLGQQRASAVLADVILPEPGERHVHGNVSFEDAYFFRSAALAAESGCGVALVHSHPGGRGWQGLSTDDYDAESGHAGQAMAITGLPMLGLTAGTGDQRWSARFWRRTGPRTYIPWQCENVRVVGGRYQASYNPALRPRPPRVETQFRTVEAWSDDVHADLVRIRLGVIGTGSVGDLVGEGLARTGVQDVLGLDFDTIETRNLDRLTHAHRRDAALHRPKVHSFVRGLRRASTAEDSRIRGLEYSVVEPAGWAEALDCDVLFACVDRPWPRAALNLLAYAHLIPVIDGGVLVDAGNGRMRGAEWRAHVAAPGRRCLECLEQYDPSMVALERAGYLDDPTYIKNVPPGTTLLPSGENVFAFAAAAASAELCQFLSMVVAPGGLADPGAQHFHFKTGTVDRDERDCEPSCLYSNQFLATGDDSGITVTGNHPFAEAQRAERRRTGRRVHVRLGRLVDDLLWRFM